MCSVRIDGASQVQVACVTCRPDRAVFAATTYVANALGRKFVEPPVLDLGETLGDSTPLSPLIFVLSAGVDPTQILRKLAQDRNMASKFFTVALGQGQVLPHILSCPVLNCIVLPLLVQRRLSLLLAMYKGAFHSFPAQSMINVVSVVVVVLLKPRCSGAQELIAQCKHQLFLALNRKLVWFSFNKSML